ncbi:B12-binding domain-containing radical SAM protein [Spirochaetia bacterium]|nr:B12-binding domain-containing radical SAM protein [Spirochaetia bacterium]
MRIVLASVLFTEGPDAVPLGAACIASALKAAFPELTLSLVETFVADGAEALTAKINAENPQAAGFSLYNWNRSIILEAANYLRIRHPDIFLFCGGPEATALPEGLLVSEGGSFDAVIPGEGEAAVVELIGRQFAILPEQAPTALENLPSPWLDGALSVKDRDGVLWELARGCPYSCAYCYESKGFKGAGKRRVRYFPEERLREELRLFIREHIPYVFVLDPTFNSNAKRAIRILDMIAAEIRLNPGPETHWHFEVRAELLTREQARRFASLGASLQIGLQTADPKVSLLIGRELDRGRFAARIGLLNEEGVVFGLDLIYGLPGDSLGGYRRSLDFALALYPNSLDMFRLAILPGTALFDKAAEYGLEADSEAPYLVRSTPDFSAGDLDMAEQVSQVADLFYNRGRAVAWFNQVLRPLRIKPSVFLEGFAVYSKTVGETSSQVEWDSSTVEGMQLTFLEAQYHRAKKEALLPAVRDLVRFHGAWGRALAEGTSTEINFTYHPDDVLGSGALDLETFAAQVKPHSVKARVRPGKQGPEMELVKGRLS